MVSAARSFLFVPADQLRRLDRAWTSPADAVIADLEDAVASDRKQLARDVLERRLERDRPQGALCVRINALESEHAAADLELVRRWPVIDAIVVPKADAGRLNALRLDRPVVALVETPAGLLDARAIASAAGVARLMLGTVDLAAELGVDIAAEAAPFSYARAVLPLASAAAGLPGPVDGPWIGIHDEAGLEAEARVARAAGFTAKACIHPAQMDLTHSVFSPSEQELEHARRVVEVSERSGSGAVTVDGRMVDVPIVRRARRLLGLTDG